MRDSRTRGRVAEGVVAFGRMEQADPYSISRLRSDAHVIACGKADAVVRTPLGRGQQVLASPTQILLMREDLAEGGICRSLLELHKLPELMDRDELWAALLDAQWLLTLRGHRVLALEGTGPVFDSGASATAIRRKALLSMAQANFSDEWRGRILPWMQMSMVATDVQSSGIDAAALDLQRSPGNDDIETLAVPPSALVGAVALDGVAAELLDIIPRREFVQASRRLPDRALSELIDDFLRLLTDFESPAMREPVERLRSLLGIQTLIGEPIHVLLDDDHTEHSRRTLASLDGICPQVRVDVMRSDERVDPDRSRSAFQWADVLVVTCPSLDSMPFAGADTTALVADLRGIDLLAKLRTEHPSSSTDRGLGDLCRRADRIVVGDMQSKDVLLGALAGAHRINDLVYDSDPSLASLISVDDSGQELVRFCRHPMRSADHVTSEPWIPEVGRRGAWKSDDVRGVRGVMSMLSRAITTRTARNPSVDQRK